MNERSEHRNERSEFGDQHGNVKVHATADPRRRFTVHR
jgi:hypothetical protein